MLSCFGINGADSPRRPDSAFDSGRATPQSPFRTLLGLRPITPALNPILEKPDYFEDRDERDSKIRQLRIQLWDLKFKLKAVGRMMDTLELRDEDASDANSLYGQCVGERKTIIKTIVSYQRFLDKLELMRK